jgi:drug/metabolite transporter (DMT)-like permease
MLTAASIYAFTGIFSRAPLEHLPPVFLGALYFSLVGVTALIALDPRGRTLRQLPWHNRWLWASTGWMGLMILTHFVALVGVETAYMLAVKRTSLLWGIVLEALWLGEPHLRRNLLAGGVMVAGVGLIALA